MKKKILITILILLPIVSGIVYLSSLSTEETHDLNARINPGSYIDIPCYKIQLPDYEGRKAIYCLDYEKTENDSLILSEWWYEPGRAVWCPKKKIGQYYIVPPYSINEVVCSSLPKE